jgi:hypothetical protein
MQQQQSSQRQAKAELLSDSGDVWTIELQGGIYRRVKRLTSADLRASCLATTLAAVTTPASPGVVTADAENVMPSKSDPSSSNVLSATSSHPSTVFLADEHRDGELNLIYSIHNMLNSRE